MPLFERRPTDIQKIGKALMVGVCVAVPILMFGPTMWVAYDNAVLSEGDRVQIGTTRYGGGAYIVDEITNDKVTATNLETGITVTVPRSQITELR